MSDKQGPSLTQPAPRMLVTVAVGMVVLIAVVTIARLRSDDPTPASSNVENLAVTALTLPNAGLGKCQVPNVRVLSAQAVAFEGTATWIEGRTITLKATDWFRGEPTKVVTVEAAGPGMMLALSGLDFEVGKRYLVSATDGQVTLCGFSAAYNPELADLYEQAYVS